MSTIPRSAESNCVRTNDPGHSRPRGLPDSGRHGLRVLSQRANPADGLPPRSYGAANAGAAAATDAVAAGTRTRTRNGAFRLAEEAVTRHEIESRGIDDRCPITANRCAMG